MITLVLQTVALLLAPPTSVINPLQMASSGMLQCHQPDTVKRTCRSLATYRPRGDGKFDNTAVVLLTPSPMIVMRTVTPVSVESGAVCGAIHRQDIDAAVISIDGVELGEDRAAPLRTRIASSMAAVIDRRICTSYVPDGIMLVAKATIDGVANPAFDQKVIWVAPDAGYKVAP